MPPRSLPFRKPVSASEQQATKVVLDFVRHANNVQSPQAIRRFRENLAGNPHYQAADRLISEHKLTLRTPAGENRWPHQKRLISLLADGFRTSSFEKVFGKTPPLLRERNPLPVSERRRRLVGRPFGLPRGKEPISLGPTQQERERKEREASAIARERQEQADLLEKYSKPETFLPVVSRQAATSADAKSKDGRGRVTGTVFAPKLSKDPNENVRNLINGTLPFGTVGPVRKLIKKDPAHNAAWLKLNWEKERNFK